MICETVKAITQQQAMSFYHNYYTAANASVLIVGDINLLQAKTIANQVTDNLPMGKKQQIIINSKPLAAEENITINFPANQSYIWIGNLAANTLSPEHYALIIANQILGGAGLTSLLAQEIRERYSLTYAIDSEFIPSRELQPFVITLQTKNSSAIQAINLIKKTLSDFVQQGPTVQQLQLTKDYLIGRFSISFSSNRQLMQMLTFLIKYHYPLNYLQTYVENINKVTTTQVQQAMQKYINPQTLLVITVGELNLTKNKKPI